MNRCRFIILLPIFVLFMGYRALGQDEVEINGHRVVLERNVPALRGSVDLPAAGDRYLVVQFDRLPSWETRTAWASQGLSLRDYLGGNAYLATLSRREALRRPIRGAESLLSAIPYKTQWKVPAALRAGRIPSWAKVGTGSVRLVVHLHADANFEEAKAFAEGHSDRVLYSAASWSMLELETPLAGVETLANHPSVKLLAFPAPPSELLNRGARFLNRAASLSLSSGFLGRGLSGDGVRVGIWDADVARHPDLDSRVRRMELERGNEALHGTHVAGTVLGGGLVNPDFRGMAPAARGWSFNFGDQRNGLTEALEMLYAYEDFGIRITQNSYGVPLAAMCSDYMLRGYSPSDYALDLLTHVYPTLTHVFAAGNSQDHCPDATREAWGEAGYGTGTSHAKNMIYVGAVDDEGQMSDFSSFGPLADGRLFPTICAKGVEVYSTAPGGSYAPLDGTSMACPVVSGTFALVAERWHKMHRGEDIRYDLLRAASANTALDGGRPGPDFQYGYGVFDGEKTLQLLERGWYSFGRLANNETKLHTIEVPANAGEVRVMLVWNDTVTADYSSAQKALINNLDLVVTASGKAHFPLVCDPRANHVTEDAKQGVDALNTMEQVVLPGGSAGAQISVSVKGTEIATLGQDYVLVWWYEQPLEPALLYPNSEEPLVAGRTARLHLQGVTADRLKVEVSFDGGKHFVDNWALARLMGVDSYSDRLLYIPADAPITSECIVRVSSADGSVHLTSSPLTVAPRIENLRFTDATACQCEELTLAWDAVPAAKEGYVVYRVDPQKQLVEEIARTKATQYAIPATPEANGQYYSVAVSLGEKHAGLRSVAVQPRAVEVYRMPQGVDSVSELFFEPYSRHYRIERGSQIAQKWQSSPYYGGHALVFSTTSSHVDGETTADTPFDDAPYATHLASLNLCGVDLRGASTEPVVMSIEGMLFSSLEFMDRYENARFRVLANGVPLADSYGQTVQLATRGGSAQWHYMLKAGDLHKLRLEFMGSAEGDAFVVEAIHFKRLGNEYSLSMQIENQPVHGARFARERFGLRLFHGGARKAEHVSVYAVVNGRMDPLSAISITDWAPQTARTVEVLVDLSTSNPLGELKRVEFVAQHGDVQVSASTTVRNVGDVLMMPFAEEACILGACNVIDPKLSVRLSRERETFTDYGGLVGDYPSRQKSTLRVLPQNPLAKVRVQFQSVELAEGDELWVYTQESPSALEELSLAPTYRFVGPCNASGTFVSDHASGALVFQLRSFDNHAKGWVGYLDEVYGPNALTLLGTKHQVQSAEPQGEIGISLEVINRLAMPIADARVRLAIGEEDTLSFALPRIEPGKQTLTLDKKVEGAQGYWQPAWLYLQSASDLQGFDNVQKILLGFDRYPIPSFRMESAPNSILSVKLKDGQELFYYRESLPELPHIAIDEPLAMYDGVGYEAVVSFGEAVEGEAFLTVLVDRNDDGAWTADELAAIALTEDNMNADRTEVSIALSLSPLAEASSHRVRLILGSEQATLSNMNNPQSWYDVWDVQVDRTPEAPIYEGDLEAVGLSLGRSGLSLSSDQAIEVTLRNKSHREFSGTVGYELTLDGVKHIGTIDCSAQPLEAYTGEGVYTLEQTGDFTEKGWHKAKIAIREQPEVVNEENNVAADSVISVVRNDDRHKALRFPSQMEGEYAIVASSALQGLFESGKLEDLSNVTLEMWVKPSGGQRQSLLADDTGFKLYITQGEEGVPDNAVAVSYPEKPTRLTQGNAIRRDRWNHLVYMKRDGVTELYVNGLLQPLGEGQEGEPTFSSPLFYYNYTGWVDMLRLWNVALTADQISASMYKELRQGGLPEECLLEFAFTEGVGNYLATSGTDAIVSIVVEEALLKDPAHGVWQPNGELLDGLSCQPGYILQSEEGYTLYVPEGVGEVNVSASLPWPNTSALCNGVMLEEGKGMVPLNASEFNLEISLPEFFGDSNFTQIYKLKVQRTSDGLLRSLSLPMASNAGLTQDVNIAVAPSMELALTADQGSIENAQSVVLAFTLAEAGVSLAVNGEAVGAGASTVTVDLSQPVLLSLRNAATRVEEQYWVSLRKQTQQIEGFALASTEYTFGADPIALTGRSTSGLPVSYVTSDSRVAVVAGGKLRIAGSGDATITAMQLGNGQYAAAAPVSVRISVRPKAVTITPVEVSLAYGGDYPLELQYEGLVSEQHRSLLPMPEVAFVDAEGREHTPHSDLDEGSNPQALFLPLGEYEVRFLTENYTTKLYHAAWRSGKLVVEAGKSHTHVQIVVVDGDGNAVQDAVVEIGTARYTTDRYGEVHVAVKHNEALQVAVSKPGFGDYHGAILAKGEHAFKRVSLTPTQYHTVAYKAQNGGSVVGPALQKVSSGGAAREVMAVALPTHHFAKWSDGEASPRRVESNVQGDLELTAEFTARRFQLTYLVGEGGEWLSGEAQQLVEAGQDGTAVEVSAKAGYEFLGWEDGLSTTARRDRGVMEDMTLTAQFGKTQKIPYSYGFEERTFTEGWHARSLEGTEFAIAWELSHQPIGGVSLDKGYALCWSGKHGLMWGRMTSYLYAPSLDLSGLTEDLHVAFDYSFTTFSVPADNEMVQVEYSFDRADWYSLGTLEQQLPLTEKRKQGYYTLENGVYAGNTTLYIRFNLTTTTGYYVLVDNFSVFASSETVELTYVSDPIGGADFVNPTTGVALPSTAARGSLLPAVLVKPQAGKYFARWADGSTDNPRSFANERVFAPREFKAILADEGTYPVELAVYPLEAGETLINGTASFSGIAKQGEVCTIEAKAKAGYRFAKWSDNGSTEITRSLENLTAPFGAVAIFERISVEVTLMAQEGTRGVPGATLTLGGATYKMDGEGKVVLQLQPGEYDWIAEAEGYTAQKGRVRVTGEPAQVFPFSLYRPFYAVMFSVEGKGRLEGEVFQLVPFGRDAQPVKAIGDEGYAVEWADGVVEAERLLTRVVADTVVNGRFVPIVYTVVYDANGGEGVMPEQSLTWDAAARLTANAFTRKGYAFQGWSTSSQGSVEYADGAEVKNLRSTPGKLTLFAQWKQEADVTSAEGVLSAFLSARVYPTPFTQSLRIEGVAEAERISIYSMLGDWVYEEALHGESSLELALSHLPEGVYLLVLESAEGRRAFRVQKQ